MKTIFTILITIFASSPSFGADHSAKENVFTKEKGFFTCNGGSAAPLFKQDCLELTLDRVSFGGDIIYEGTCLDSNGKQFVLSCTNFAFEPNKLTASTKKNYFDK